MFISFFRCISFFFFFFSFFFFIVFFFFFFFFFLILRRLSISTLFPYTTLFRSRPRAVRPRSCAAARGRRLDHRIHTQDRKSTRLNSSHSSISYAVFCLKKKKKKKSQLR